jgi:hypothetical protein
MRGSQFLQEEAIVTTWSGRHIDLLNPVPSQIHIDDIAWSLARTMRFNGHTSRPYSVAEHCLLGVGQCPAASRLAFLLHDAAEAYLGDVVGPLKRTQMFAWFRGLEAQWEAAISLRFGLPCLMNKTVELIDQRMLMTELRDLMGRRPLSTDRHRPFSMVIGAAPESLAERFIAKFELLAPKASGARW